MCWNKIKKNIREVVILKLMIDSSSKYFRFNGSTENELRPKRFLCKRVICILDEN